MNVSDWYGSTGRNANAWVISMAQDSIAASFFRAETEKALCYVCHGILWTPRKSLESSSVNSSRIFRETRKSRSRSGPEVSKCEIHAIDELLALMFDWRLNEKTRERSVKRIVSHFSPEKRWVEFWTRFLRNIAIRDANNGCETTTVYQCWQWDEIASGIEADCALDDDLGKCAARL